MTAIAQESRQAYFRAADDYRRRYVGYKLDTTSHLNPEHNRTVIRGTFMFLQKIDAPKAQSLSLMKYMKDKIRARDAEPAAWFTGPTRTQWVSARRDCGELQTNEEIGRALEGKEATQ